MASADFAALVRPNSAARTGESFAVSLSGSMLLGIGGISPSGGFNNEMFGIGMGIGTFVSWLWMNTMGSVAPSLLKVKLSDSQLVCASMLMFNAGCGTPTRTSGPQYAMLMPGCGPGSR